MEKVVLPKEVADAITNLRNAGLTDFYIIGNAYNGNRHDADLKLITEYINENANAFDDEEEKGYMHIMKALVNGYEVKQTPEDKVKEMYQKSTEHCFRKAIFMTLSTLNIKIEGVNA